MEFLSLSTFAYDRGKKNYVRTYVCTVYKLAWFEDHGPDTEYSQNRLHAIHFGMHRVAYRMYENNHKLYLNTYVSRRVT